MVVPIVAPMRFSSRLLSLAGIACDFDVDFFTHSGNSACGAEHWWLAFLELCRLLRPPAGMRLVLILKTCVYWFDRYVLSTTGSAIHRIVLYFFQDCCRLGISTDEKQAKQIAPIQRTEVQASARWYELSREFHPKATAHESGLEGSQRTARERRRRWGWSAACVFLDGCGRL